MFAAEICSAKSIPIYFIVRSPGGEIKREVTLVYEHWYAEKYATKI